MKHFFILFLLIIPILASAQEFSVLKVEELLSDSTAIKFPRYDYNDDICATLSVEIMSIDNISFTGNIIGDVNKSGDKYRLYLTSGTKRIKLMHEDFLPMAIDFSQYGISIKGGHSYRVSLKTSKPQMSNVSYGPGAQYLVFKSSIPITKVVVNEEEWTISEGKAKKMVPLGRYEYIVYSGDLVSKGTAEVKSTTTSKVVNVVFE